jgi:PAN domain
MQEDLEGVAATTPAECAAACEETMGCNGASFYPDPAAFFGSASLKNCWLKTFVDTCEPPATSEMDPLAVLLLKPTPDCALLVACTVILFALSCPCLWTVEDCSSVSRLGAHAWRQSRPATVDPLFCDAPQALPCTNSIQEECGCAGAAEPPVTVDSEALPANLPTLDEVTGEAGAEEDAEAPVGATEREFTTTVVDASGSMSLRSVAAAFGVAGAMLAL